MEWGIDVPLIFDSYFLQVAHHEIPIDDDSNPFGSEKLPIILLLEEFWVGDALFMFLCRDSSTSWRKMIETTRKKLKMRRMEKGGFHGLGGSEGEDRYRLDGRGWFHGSS